MQEVSRSLASIKRIDEILTHPNADTLDLARIGGWQVCVRRDEFKAGDLVIFFTIDSWIPIYIAPFLCDPDKPKTYEGVEGARLRTVRLRGEWSQGLILSTSILPPEVEIEEDKDLTEFLGIMKWEAPVHPQLRGIARGSFPHWTRKTDAERAQGMTKEIFSDPDRKYEITVKIDGSSTTYAMKDGVYYVCSRNINIRPDNTANSFVSMGIRLGMEELLRKTERNLAIQGELFGSKICRNNEKINSHEFAVFSVWDIDNQQYLPPAERRELIAKLGLPHVPVLYEEVSLRELGVQTMQDLLNLAEGPSWNKAVKREGIVFKSSDGETMFKVIDNNWLLKNQ